MITSIKEFKLINEEYDDHGNYIEEEDEDDLYDNAAPGNPEDEDEDESNINEWMEEEFEDDDMVPFDNINMDELETKFLEFASVHPKSDYPLMRQTYNFIKTELLKYKK